ncbi:MAG: hypothetical protein U0787_13400 [Polyangia bacterium]
MTVPRLDLVLERLRHRIATADVLAQAFAEWLGVYELGSGSIGEISGLWTPREVAIAGLREATGKAVSRPFSVGLAWLKRREFFRPHVTPVFEADPLAILAVAIGTRHIGDPFAKQWIASIATKSMVDETDPWRKGMLSGATAAADEGLLHAPAELLVALASRGIGRADAAAKQAAFEAALAVDDVPGERCAARLASIAQPAAPDIPAVHVVRGLLDATLRSDSDLDAFCLDFFPETHRRFTNGMDRVAKQNILLTTNEPQQIVDNLNLLKKSGRVPSRIPD